MLSIFRIRVQEYHCPFCFQVCLFLAPFMRYLDSWTKPDISSIESHTTGLEIEHVFWDTRTSGVVLFAQILNLSSDLDVPLANSKTSLCRLHNKLTRLAIIVVIWTRVWIYIAIMDETDEKFQRRNYWIINVDILFTENVTVKKTLAGTNQTTVSPC